MRKRLLLAASLVVALGGFAFGQVAQQTGFPVALTGSLPSGHGIWAGASTIADLDGDGDYEIVVATMDEDADKIDVIDPDTGEPMIDPDTGLVVQADVSDNFIYAFHHDGTPVEGFPIDNNVNNSRPVTWMEAYDIDGDGADEVIASQPYYGDINIIEGDGTRTSLQLDGWGNKSFATIPCIGDVDGDGDVEIVITHRDSTHQITVRNLATAEIEAEWNYGASSNITEGLGIGDLNGDGIMEIVAVDNTVGIFAFEPDGTAYSAWPTTGVMVGCYESATTVTIGNVDTDPELEIVVTSFNNDLYVINHDGTIAFTAPKSGNGRVQAPLVDLWSVPANWWGQDGVCEIFYADTIYDGAGNVLGHLPEVPNGTGCPVFADFNQDGVCEAIYTSGNTDVSVYNFVNAEKLFDWPATVEGVRTGYFHHWHTTTPLVADLDGDKDLEVVVATGDSTKDSTNDPMLNVFDDTTEANLAAESYWRSFLLNAETNAVVDQIAYGPVWPIAGDANMDCKVNIIDLIYIRNRLNKDVSTGDNWLADVNSDGRINIIDLIYVRNRLNTRCE